MPCRWKEAGLDCLEVVKGSVKADVKQASESIVQVGRHLMLLPWASGIICLCFTKEAHISLLNTLWVQVQVEWLLRPSQDEALRSAHIGASGVSEVFLKLILHKKCFPLCWLARS